MQLRNSLFLGLAFATMQNPQAHAFFGTSKDTKTLQEDKSTQEDGAASDLDKREQERKSIELENALDQARLAKELAALTAEVERLKLEKSLMTLKWEIEQEKNQKAHEKEMRELNQQQEKLAAEAAISQAKVQQVMEAFNLTSAELHNKVRLLKKEAEGLQAEVEQLNAKKKRANYADGGAVYLKEPLQKDGTLVISDRRIDFNGVVTPWKANYVTDRIQFFNNQNTNYPIFIVIEDSPGGSVQAGFRILKAMEKSQAPVYVVVKGFAASMAAVITTLAENSCAYPNAIILHHQPWTFMRGNVRETKEAYKFLEEWWNRLGGRVAKKMGISLKKLDKLLYEKSARGDWKEFADKAKKLKWVDCIISGIKDSSVREMPDPANYTCGKYFKEYFGVTAETAPTGGSVVNLPALGPQDFYYLYNPDNRYQISSSM